jgi:hypothetical protein
MESPFCRVPTRLPTIASLPSLKKTTGYVLPTLPACSRFRAAHRYCVTMLQVCTISYPRSDLCIYPSTMRPPSDGSAASSRLSGMLIPKTKAAAAAVAGVGTTAAQKIAAPPGSGSPRMQAEVRPRSNARSWTSLAHRFQTCRPLQVAFMTGIRYALLGYPPANLSLPPGAFFPALSSLSIAAASQRSVPNGLLVQAPKLTRFIAGPASNPEQRRVNSVVPYLARPGGAHYVSEKDLTHANTDLIVVRPSEL